MAFKLGLDAKLNYKAGGQSAGGAWAVMGNVKDVTLNLEKGTAEVTTRANNGWKAIVAALKDASVEFEMVWDTADAAFTAILQSFLNNTVIGFQVLDSAGGQGLQADFMVVKCSRKESLEEALTATVEIRPTYSATAPSWIGA